MMAIVAAEFPLVQPHLYDAQIPPVVYLSGALLFVAGLAIVRAHQCVCLGRGADTSAVWMVLEGLLFAAGLAITLGAYRRKRR